MSEDTTAPRERPILFSGGMVREILAGRKTETRRIVRSGEGEMLHAGWPCHGLGDPRLRCGAPIAGHHHIHVQISGAPHRHWASLRSPYGAEGDTLWVREAWAAPAVFDTNSPKTIGGMAYEAGYDPPWSPLWYRADGSYNEALALHVTERDWGGQGKWRPSIFMPRWACRLRLKVLEVRIERLQDIDDKGALAEGVMGARREAPRELFHQLWDGINSKRSPWESNCWVWVVRFEVTP